MARVHAHRLIAAADTCLQLETTLPSESVARELAPLREQPALLRKVWERALVKSEHPTAADVRAVRGEVFPNLLPMGNTLPSESVARQRVL